MALRHVSRTAEAARKASEEASEIEALSSDPNVSRLAGAVKLLADAIERRELDDYNEGLEAAERL